MQRLRPKVDESLIKAVESKHSQWVAPKFAGRLPLSGSMRGGLEMMIKDSGSSSLIASAMSPTGPGPTWMSEKGTHSSGALSAVETSLFLPL